MLAEILTFVAVFAACSGAVAVFFAYRVSRQAPPRRLAQIELELAELREMHESLLESHKRFRSREGMRDLRQRRKKADGAAPDPYTDPEGWKRAMERQRALSLNPAHSEN